MPVSEEVCACGFEFLRTFLRIFVFVNEEVCEIVLIISGSTDYEFHCYFLFQSFDVKCLLLSCDACVYRQAREW